MLNNTSVPEIIQNLKDAGCDAKTVERFMELQETGKTEEQSNEDFQDDTGKYFLY